MFIVAGLGNPSADYALTRHNFGFMAADTIAESYGFPPFSNKFSGLVSVGEIKSQKVMLLKPLTFMNLSGDSVAKAVSFYKESLSNLVVIHDDLDIDFGKIKAKTGGSAGGHNGLRSIDSHLGTNYSRIRLGISSPFSRRDVKNFVLSRFSKEELEELPIILADVAEALPCMLASNGANPAAFTNALGLIKNKRGV